MERYIPCKRPERLENIKWGYDHSGKKQNYNTIENKIDKDEYIRLTNKGFNGKEIAEILNVKYYELNYWRERTGFKHDRTY